MRILFLSIFSLMMVRSAMAHGGHVGELAGHSHLVGWAALAGAAGIAALIAKAKLGKKNDAPSDEPEIEAEPDDNAGETA